MAVTLRSHAPDVRRILTPEGVPLNVVLAGLGDRAAAFAIDGLIIGFGLVAVGLIGCLVPALGRVAGDWVAALASAMIFVLLNGYFIWFELKSSGQTPGKQAVGIRVLSRSGVALQADAIIARNLMRDVEFFLPAIMLAFGGDILPDTSVWTRGLACAWLLALALVPVFNRDRLRVGDLVGGTWVVRNPRAALQQDLAKREATGRAGRAAPEPAHTFTPQQIEVYGIYELQTLEDVLRSTLPGADDLRKAVAARIVRKIGYRVPGSLDARRFLQDFYAALRAHLERRVLFGKRKERKDR